MRVAFVGKGGSGKTTISSLFSLYCASEGKSVLALDADINQHLAPAIGVKSTLRSMGNDLNQIKLHLRGSNALIDPNQMHKTTPPGTGSRFVRLNSNDWFIKNFCKTANGVSVAGAGEIPEGNIGVRCYHGLNGAVELVVGHMLDGKNDVVVIDMTAGADAFSSTLFAKVDALVLVVEATLKSISVYNQFIQNVSKYKIPLLVVGNKIQDADDSKFLLDNLPSAPVVTFGFSSYVKRRERGEDISVEEMDKELKSRLSILSSEIQKINRDWDVLEKRSHDLHAKNAEGWIGRDALSHIDSTFNLKRFAEENLL